MGADDRRITETLRTPERRSGVRAIAAPVGLGALRRHLPGSVIDRSLRMRSCLQAGSTGCSSPIRIGASSALLVQTVWRFLRDER